MDISLREGGIKEGKTWLVSNVTVKSYPLPVINLIITVMNIFLSVLRF